MYGRQLQRRYRLLWLMLAAASLMLAGAAPAEVARAHPCATASANRQDLPPMAEARRQLEAYAADKAVLGAVELREEGGFMLGAYPRERVLWSIRVLTPPSGADDAAQADIALAAYCLRRGWVWMYSPGPSGATTWVSYTERQLEGLRNRIGTAALPYD